MAWQSNDIAGKAKAMICFGGLRKATAWQSIELIGKGSVKFGEVSSGKGFVLRRIATAMFSVAMHRLGLARQSNVWQGLSLAAPCFVKHSNALRSDGIVWHGI